jgi:hypothetical protein
MIVNYGCKKFDNIGPRPRIPLAPKKNDRLLNLQEESTISFSVNGKPISGEKNYCLGLISADNGTPRIRRQCRKIAVLSCHLFLINSGVEKMNNI